MDLIKFGRPTQKEDISKINNLLKFDVSQQLVNYFEPNLKINDGAKIDGSFDGNSNNLVLNADIPSVNIL
jgi:hypothetical protein